MKNFLLLISISFLVGRNCEAQNLVPNPSFEDTVECPWMTAQINFAAGWSAFGGSPDYYNACDTDYLMMGTHNANYNGYQFPADGDGYCGLVTYHSQGFVREIAGRQLSAPLIPNHFYLASMKVSLADGINCASNNLGILFSTVAYTVTNPAPSSNFTQVYSSQVISDTANWTTISGVFQADSQYQYISIGNFFTDNQTDTLILWEQIMNVSYYYIDDVDVHEIPDTSVHEGIYSSPEKNSITIYPNPATEQLIIDNGQLIIKEIEISDALGRVQSCELIRQGGQRPSTQIDIHSLPSGIYFIKVYFADGSMEVRNFIKQ